MKKLREQREQGLNEKTDEQIFQEVLGKDTHGYLRAYGPGKSITQHFNLKPSRINLHDEVVEVKKNAAQAVQEARTDADNARKEAEDARKEAEDAKKEAEEARKDAEFAKNEAEATRKEVDLKISINNKIWENKINRILQSFGLNLPNDDGSSSDDGYSTDDALAT